MYKDNHIVYDLMGNICSTGHVIATATAFLWPSLYELDKLARLRLLMSSTSTRVRPRTRLLARRSVVDVMGMLKVLVLYRFIGGQII